MGRREKSCILRIKPLALGLAIGIFWGSVLFVCTWLSWLTGYGRLFLDALASSIYPGYSITPLGSLLALFYGFIDGLVSGLVVAWLYNLFASRLLRHDEAAPER